MSEFPYKIKQEMDPAAAELLNTGAIAIETATGATLLAAVLQDDKGVFLCTRPGAEAQTITILGTTDWVELLRIAEAAQ